MSMSVLEKLEKVKEVTGDQFLNSCSREHINILKGNIGQAELEVLKTVYEVSYARDSRDSIRYAQDIILNWILEDYVFINSKRILGVQLHLNGTDKDRNFLPETKIGSDADFYFEHNCRKVYLEMVTNFTDFWTRTGKLHLRGKKYNKLVNSGTKLLAVDLYSKKIGTVKLGEAKYIPEFRAFGGKPANEIDIDVKTLKNLGGI